MVGRRHYEVAKLLKDIPIPILFTLRLIEPLKVGFCTLFLNKIYKRKVNFKCNKYNCTSFFFSIQQISSQEDPNEEKQRMEMEKRLCDLRPMVRLKFRKRYIESVHITH